MALFSSIRSDLCYNLGIDDISFFIYRKLFSYRMFALVLLRFTLNGHRFARVFLLYLYHIEIGKDVIIGDYLFLPHPMGITIASGTRIGNNCAIYQHVTFAEKGGQHLGPTIGNNVIVGPGSLLIGNVKIGDDVKIIGNSVVSMNINSSRLVSGNPAREFPLLAI